MRDYKMDNIRAFLIFLVVFGHFMELLGASGRLGYVNEVIYSFHMPAFLFVSGYFARFKPRRIVLLFLYPYLVLQIVYCFFNKYYLGIENVDFAFSVPNYTLWYLPAMAFFCLLIPLIDVSGTKKRLAVVGVSIAVSLISGMDPNIEYPFAMGRILSFLPFFLIGFYCKRGEMLSLVDGLKKSYKLVLGGLSALAVIICQYIILKSDKIEWSDMRGVFSYEKTDSSPAIKAFLLLAGAVCIAFLVLAAPKKKIPMVSAVGKYTFPIYVLHGFVVKILVNNNITHMSPKEYLFAVFLISAGLLVVLGNKWMAAGTKWVLTGHWIERLLDRKKKKA